MANTLLTNPADPSREITDYYERDGFRYTITALDPATGRVNTNRTAIEPTATQTQAKDLTIIGHAVAADATASAPHITTLLPAIARSRQDAISVSAETTIDGKVFTPGLWYLPEDNAAANVNDFVKLTGTESESALSYTLVELQARTFESLTEKTGLPAYVTDTEETVIYSETSTAESVAPRKSYQPANPPDSDPDKGIWIVTSPSPISQQTAIADGKTPFQISIPTWSTLKFVKFQTQDNRPSIDRISPIFTFTKDDFTRDHDGWVYTEISANEYQHTIESPSEYFFTMTTVVDTALDTAVTTLSDIHATEPNKYGGITGAVVAYNTAPTYRAAMLSDFNPAQPEYDQEFTISPRTSDIIIEAKRRFKDRAIDLDFIKNISITDLTDGDTWVSWDVSAKRDIFYSYRATGPVADMVPGDFRPNDAAVTGTVAYWHKHVSGSSELTGYSPYVLHDVANGRLRADTSSIQYIDMPAGETTIFLPDANVDPVSGDPADTGPIYFQIPTNRSDILIEDPQSTLSFDGGNKESTALSKAGGIYRAQLTVAGDAGWAVTSLPTPFIPSPTASGIPTARYRPRTFFAAGSGIIEPNPANDFKNHIWTADEDILTGDSPDFDGTGFTVQQEAPANIGTENDIVGGNTAIKDFAGNTIAKAADITARDEAVVREFVPSAPVEQWGPDVAGGQIRTVISTVNGEQYEIREGKTVTLQFDPSENLVEWVRSSDIAPPEWTFALTDLQALTFEFLVGKTGQIAYVVDTKETVQYDQGATAASVAPRKAYESANPAVGQEGIGVWIVTSPEPQVGSEPARVLIGEAAATTGGSVEDLNKSLTEIKDNYHHLEFYSLSDGFGNPIQTSGGTFLAEHLTDGVPFRVDVSGRALIFTPKDNGAANATLVNGSQNAGAQNIKIFGVKDQTTITVIDSTDLVVDLNGVVEDDKPVFKDDGNGGFILAKSTETSEAGVKIFPDLTLFSNNTTVDYLLDLSGPESYFGMAIQSQAGATQDYVVNLDVNAVWVGNSGLNFCNLVFSAADRPIRVNFGADFINRFDTGVPSTITIAPGDRYHVIQIISRRGLRAYVNDLGATPGEIYSDVSAQPIVDANWHEYAANLPTLQVGDLISVVVDRGGVPFPLNRRFGASGEIYEFRFEGDFRWIVKIVGSVLSLKVEEGGGAQSVTSVKIIR